ncbi:hypothetical protein [Nocardioides sp. cx-173]|uniref:hypothetical protein n=1 Tax=Nocardioides sp. cx-173 TaxID=2898796 RepID=UPI001E3B0A81|nr:hypothetical protein [Nocardioides sp. cx-173]MCD4526984.1 hypothetical protein [Nocardioides sp. cx-173]UGB41081.1 hypothetical protein LQ940_17130 [Nocardioides sp. cx-173]
MPLTTLTTLVLMGGLLAASPAGADPSRVRVGSDDAAERRAPGAGRAATSARSDYADGAVRRVAQLTDVRAAGADPATNIARATVVQDLRASRITATVTLGATPGANSVVYVHLGEWSGDTCQSRAAVAGATTTADTAGLIGSASLAVSSSRAGAVLTLTSAAASAVRTAEWDCAFAFSTDVGGTETSGLYADDLETVWTPRLAIARGAPVQGSYRGRWTTVEVDLLNSGRADARGTTVRLSGAGLAFKPATRSYGTLGPRSTEYFEKFRVRLKGSKPRTLRMTLTAQGGHRAVATVRIVEKPRPRTLPSLVGRYYWGHKPVQVDRGWDNVAVRFVSPRFAHVGFDKVGAPRCAKASRTCRPYQYNARTGVVRVAGLGKGRATTEGIRLGKQDYFPLSTPKPGAKLALRLIHQNFEGTCGIYCSTWTEWLTMDQRGRFVRSRQTLGSIGAPGVGTVWAVVPADERGTYRVLSRGRIRLSYANGTSQVHTIGIGHDVRGKPSPAGEGILLDDVNFYLD